MTSSSYIVHREFWPFSGPAWTEKPERYLSLRRPHLAMGVVNDTNCFHWHYANLSHKVCVHDEESRDASSLTMHDLAASSKLSANKNSMSWVVRSASGSG